MPLIETADLRMRCLLEGVSEDPCIVDWPLDYDPRARGSQAAAPGLEMT